MSKKVLEIKRVKFDVKGLADSLCISEKHVISTFRDGRTASRFTEFWSSNLHGYEVNTSPCAKDNDGFVKCVGDFKSPLSAKVLSKQGVKFQFSRNVGQGRTCTTDDVIKALESADWYCIIDIREFPISNFMVLNSKLILKWIRTGDLSTSGLTAKKFYLLLSQYFEDIIERSYIYDSNTKLFVQSNDIISEKIEDFPYKDSGTLMDVFGE